MTRAARRKPDDPESQAHAQECEIVRDKLAAYLADHQIEDVHEADNRPALRVVPTRDRTARVHMTLDQFAELVGLSRTDLALAEVDLEHQL